MTTISRYALRTAESNGRIDAAVEPTPQTNDQTTPVSDTSALPAQLRRPPTSDGTLIPYNSVPGSTSIYTSPPVLGSATEVNTTPPQIMNREA